MEGDFRHKVSPVAPLDLQTHLCRGEEGCWLQALRSHLSRGFSCRRHLGPYAQSSALSSFHLGKTYGLRGDMSTVTPPTDGKLRQDVVEAESESRACVPASRLQIQSPQAVLREAQEAQEHWGQGGPSCAAVVPGPHPAPAEGPQPVVVGVCWWLQGPDWMLHRVSTCCVPGKGPLRLLLGRWLG